jgi:serine/threonine-protein phosphatase 2A regulatory subunit A
VLEVELKKKIGRGNNFKMEPVAILIDELRHGDSNVKLNAFRKIQFISSALGPARTVSELIPYLTDLLEGEDDEILLALAEELGKLITCTGIGQEWHLLEPLEALAKTEETAVRDQAVKSILAVLHVISVEQTLQHFVPMLNRLANGDWFTSRCSACALLQLCYQKIGDQDTIKGDLRRAFATLCGDETPQVRRAACTHLGNFSKVVESKYVQADILEAFAKLAADDQDSVRLLAVEGSASLVKVLVDHAATAAVIRLGPMIATLCHDKSWRVRYMVATKFCELMQADVTVDAAARFLNNSLIITHIF